MNVATSISKSVAFTNVLSKSYSWFFSFKDRISSWTLRIISPCAQPRIQRYGNLMDVLYLFGICRHFATAIYGAKDRRG